MFASDFPHEIAMDNCMEEIDEILERDDLRPEHKPLLLGENARRFYKFRSGSLVLIPARARPRSQPAPPGSS